MPTFRSILVADDEPSIRHVLSLVLKDHGYEVRAVSDGEEAVRELAARSYDVLLCDVRMPKRDGLSVLRHAKAEYPGLTVLVMSAYGSQEQALEAVGAGRGGSGPLLERGQSPHVAEDREHGHDSAEDRRGSDGEAISPIAVAKSHP